ncbi:type II secretion system protein [Desulfonatronum parangueonense]
MPSASPPSSKAFTLVEVALALAVMGLIGAMTFPLLSHFLNQQKVARTETILEVARSEALGYAMNTLFLPGNIGHLGHQVDAWRNELVYIRSNVDLCAHFDGHPAEWLRIELPQGRTIVNVAFALISPGRNRVADFGYDPGSGTITILEPGASINGRQYDDMLTYMTVDFLRSKVWERCPEDEQ